MRILLLDAIERIEVAVRTRFVYHFVQSHGPFGHLSRTNLPRFKDRPPWEQLMRNIKRLATLRSIERDAHGQWLAKLLKEKNRAADAFVTHFEATYGDEHDHLPLWMACELMTCETALRFVNAVDMLVVKRVAADFGFPDEQLLSWTKAVFSLRNSCAHHARVWNRAFGLKPSVPGKNKNPNWHVQPGFALARVGLQMTVCHFWLGKVSSTTRWKRRILALFDEYPEIPIAEMGHPANWRAHPLWV